MGPEEAGPEDRSGEGTEIEPPGSGREEPMWWESAKGHMFALEVLQLRVRRDILKFIGDGARSTEEIAEKFGIDEWRAAFHLAMLDKAPVVEPVRSGRRSKPTGLLNLKKIETPYPGKF
jgi:hypothetical protein